MIEPGDGWRFREQLLDLPLLQDQVVEHVLTGHQAVRRVFADEVCHDERAMEEIKEQIAHCAAVTHPGIQRLYKVETINKRLAVTMEYIQGTSLKNLTLAHSFKSPARWASHARLLVRLLRSMGREGLAIDCVRLSSLVFVGGSLGLTAHRPVSPHPKDTDGVVLKSLRQVPIGGVYARGEASPRATEWKQLMTLLYFMASGQIDRDIFAAEEFYSSQQHAHSRLGIELPIEQLLLRFADETNPETVWHWDDLLSGIELLTHRTDKETHRQRIMAPPPPTSSSSRQKSSETDASVEQVRFTLETPDRPPVQPVIIAPKAPATLQEVAEAQTHAAAAIIPEPPPVEELTRRTRDEVFTRDEMRMPGRMTIDDDAEEDRTYLYPSSTSAEAVKKSGTTAVRRRSAISKRHLVVIGGGVLGAALLAAVVYGVVNIIGSSGRGPNQPPVAVIAPVDRPVPAYEPIQLDGAKSHDPDDDQLTYNWSVVGLNRGDQYLIEPNNSLNAGKPTLRIYAPGEYTVQLQVFDAAMTSEPATTTVRITEPLLRAR